MHGKHDLSDMLSDRIDGESSGHQENGIKDEKEQTSRDILKNVNNSPDAKQSYH